MAEIAALVGDPARANMLAALIDGRALPAGELAFLGRVSPQTASGHLARLAAANLIVCNRQGRHRYYRLATPQVARMLESIMSVAAQSVTRYRPPSRDEAALRFARTCYDHLAGRLGVAVADRLVERKLVVLGEDGGLLTDAGKAFFESFGLDLTNSKRRVFCRPCLDWSERRPHIAGAVGAALTTRLLELGWIARMRDSRAVSLTQAGEAGLVDSLGLSLGGLSGDGSLRFASGP